MEYQFETSFFSFYDEIATYHIKFQYFHQTMHKEIKYAQKYDNGVSLLSAYHIP